MPFRTHVASTLVLLMCGATPASDQAYGIRLTRPAEAGDRLAISSEASIHSETFTLSGGRERSAGDLRIIASLDSTAVVLKVDGHGRPTAMAHTVGTCTMIVNGELRVILPPGATLIARKRGRQTSFFVKRREFEELELRALETLAGLDTYRATSDELFGTSADRRVGESWPVNTAEIADEFRAMTGQAVPVTWIDGSTTLEEIREHGAEPCQLLHTQLSVVNVLPGYDELPPGAQLRSARLSVQSFELLPLDPRRFGVERQRVLEMDAVVTDFSGHRARDVHVTGLVRSRRQFTPIDRTAGAEP